MIWCLQERGEASPGSLQNGIAQTRFYVDEGAAVCSEVPWNGMGKDSEPLDVRGWMLCCTETDLQSIRSSVTSCAGPEAPEITFLPVRQKEAGGFPGGCIWGGDGHKQSTCVPNLLCQACCARFGGSHVPLQQGYADTGTCPAVPATQSCCSRHRQQV